MSKLIHVAPAEGRTLKEVNGMTVPAEGRNFPDSSWWRRRERDGDAIISKFKRTTKKPKKGSEA
ncbi:DUF2635 domain-containing protein [Sphingorhabdus sp. 109]|uniref:DUF2635 domain-containing protein n=1 Tax=Sphingorhabdus sp. 109 TaxID=2653173 RepID=UPI0012F33468|nr:DUF2635 domain-containing protein [Sphingorhabdus sp. 109]VWX62592.1 conserved hypothetical protein [Sphingorhabdus sp. 109]